jgi:hypothetical protein
MAMPTALRASRLPTARPKRRLPNTRRATAMPAARRVSRWRWVKATRATSARCRGVDGAFSASRAR